MACKGCPEDQSIMATDPSAPAWTITNQADVSDLGPEGMYVPGVRITFRTRAGVTSSVFVPKASYTVENVRAIVSAQAETADAIAGMQG